MARRTPSTGPPGVATAAPLPSQAVFNMIDRNHDGVISEEEWMSAMQQKGGGTAQFAYGGRVGRAFGKDMDVTNRTDGSADVDNDVGNIPSPSALRPGQKRKFPTHWGVPPLMQTRDYVAWPEGYGAGSSTVAEWISDNIRKDVARGGSPHDYAGPEAAAGGHRGFSPPSPPQGPHSACQSAAAAAAAAAAASASAAAASAAAQGTPDGAWTPPRGQLASNRGSSPAGIWRSGSGAAYGNQALALSNDQRGLTTSLETELRSRTRDVVGQRAELEKAIESARRARVSDAVERQRSASARSGRGQQQHLQQQCREGSPQNAKGLAARMGAATARKVAEIERLLLEELEQTLVLKAGYIASCLHNWRREITLEKQKRQMTDLYEKELQRSQASFTRHLAQREHILGEEFKGRESRRREAVQRQRALMMDKWREGDTKAIMRESLLVWHGWAIEEKKRDVARRQTQTFGAVISRFAQSQDKGLQEFIMTAWKEALREATVNEAKQRVIERTALRWAEGQGQSTLKASFYAWQHRSKATYGVLARLENSSSRGLMNSGFRGWLEQWRLKKTTEAPHMAVAKMGQRWMGQQASALTRMVFQAWHHHTMGESRGRMEDEQRKALMKLQEEHRLEEARLRDERNKAAKDQKHNAVQMVLKKWEMGAKKGLTKEVTQVWSNYAKSQAIIKKQKAGVQATTQRWLEGQKRGGKHSVFNAWREAWISAKKMREAEKAQQEETRKMCKFLEEEKKALQDQLHKHKTAAQLKAEQLNKALGFSLTRWDKGDAMGFATEVFRAWAADCNAKSRLAAKQQAVRAALLQACEGKDKAAVHFSFVNWHTFIKESKLLNEAAKAREVAVAKWLKGNASGMLAVTFTEWRELFNKKKQQESVRFALEKAFVGDTKALLCNTFREWLGQVVISKAIKRERGEKDTALAEANARGDLLVSKAQEKLSKFTSIMSSGDGKPSPIFMKTLISSWRSHTHGVLAEEWERKLRMQQEDAKRASELDQTKRREATMRALHKMGLNDSKALTGECFLAWSMLYQKERMERIQKIERNKQVGKLGTYLAMNKMKQDAHSIQSTVLMEWLKIARIEAREAEKNSVQAQFDEANGWVMQLEQQRAGLEEQLWLAYKQIDHITETLQKELKTKEELAAELREAYDKMRRTSFPGGISSITPLGSSPALGDAPMSSRVHSRPGSASSRTRSTGACASTKIVAGRDIPSASPPSLMYQDSYISGDQLRGIAQDQFRGSAQDAEARIGNDTDSDTFNPRAMLNGLGSGGLFGDDGFGGLGTSSCTWGDAIRRMKSEGLIHERNDGLL